MNYVGIDIGGTNVKAGLVLGDGTILKKSSIKTGATRKAEKIIDDIINQIKELTQNSDYEAVGICCPGAIDSATGMVQYSNNLDWHNVPLGETISKALNKPVKVCNDANGAAMGEYIFGLGKKYTDIALITLGTGVGSGFVVGGQLFEGYKSLGAEGGHIVTHKDGLQCSCGRRGCFEMYASANALIRETINAMHIYRNSIMWQIVDNDLNKVGGHVAFEAAKKGDIAGKIVIENYISELAEGIADILNLFRSQAIIIGGGVSAQKEALTEPLCQKMREMAYGGDDSLIPEILTASLGNDAGILGAASLVVK